jgi:hypothetical protein
MPLAGLWWMSPSVPFTGTLRRLPLTCVSGAGAQVVTRLHALLVETFVFSVLTRVVVQGCTDIRPGAYRRDWLPLV